MVFNLFFIACPFLSPSWPWQNWFLYDGGGSGLWLLYPCWLLCCLYHKRSRDKFSKSMRGSQTPSHGSKSWPRKWSSPPPRTCKAFKGRMKAMPLSPNCLLFWLVNLLPLALWMPAIYAGLDLARMNYFWSQFLLINWWLFNYANQYTSLLIIIPLSCLCPFR